MSWKAYCRAPEYRGVHSLTAVCAQALKTIYAQLEIVGSLQLSSMAGSFSSLTTVGGYMSVSSNGLLSLDGAFPVRLLCGFQISTRS